MTIQTGQSCLRRFVQAAVALSAVALTGTFISMSAAGAERPTSGDRPPLMDRQKEIELAVSACPESIGSKAGVYILTNSGYVRVRESQNGFTAIVQHSVPSAQEPQCLDAEGSRTFLPRILKLAELRAQGLSAPEVKAAMAEALAKGLLHPPTRPGIDYMLSRHTITPDDKGVVVPFPPHVMFYAPYMTNAELGSGGQAAGGPAFVAAEGTPFALIIVPVAEQTSPHHSMTNMDSPDSPPSTFAQP
jgi:hypothetical protein